MIKSSCPKIGNTHNALADEGIIMPVFVHWMGATVKANGLFAALDWLKSQGYYHVDNKSQATFTYVYVK